MKRSSTKLSSNISGKEVIFDGIKITHPYRIMGPIQTLSKLKIVQYYDFISELMLPHIANRPTVLVRCTEALNHNKGKPIKEHNTDCFYQKHYTASFPKFVYSIDIEEKESDPHDKKQKNPYIYIKNKKGLLSLIQFATLEVHSWGATCKQLEKPDRIVFDLDPSPDFPWKKVIATAFLIRERLEDLGLISFVKTTGGKGLHVMVPIQSKNTWSEVKLFAKFFAKQLVEENPTLYTTNPLKIKRQNKIFIDYLRNSRGALFIAPYSTRAKPGAPISTPLSWEELVNLKSSTQYSVSNIKKRINTLKVDPWEGFFKCRQSLKLRLFHN